MILSVAAKSGASATLIADPGQSLAAISLRLSVGSRHDPPGRSGLAHITEHMMFSGTKRYGRGEHIRAVQAAGCLINAKTSADWTKYYHVATSDLLAPLLELERERFTQTAEMMTAQGLDLERAVVLNERRQRMDNVAYGTAVEKLMSELFEPGASYHHLPIGAVDEVGEVSLSDCREFHARHYAGSRVNVALVGNFDPDSAAQQVMILLEAFPGHDDPDPDDVARPLAATRRVCVRSDFKPKVYLGMHLPEEGSWEFDMARLASLFLGRGASSRLPDRLERQSGIAAGIAVKTMGRAHGNSVGIIEATPSSPDGTERTIAAVDEVIAAAMDGDLDAAATERAKAVYRSSWLSDDDSLERRSDALSLCMQLTGSVAAYLQHDERIRGVTAADLRAALRYWHQPDRRVELVYAR